MALQLSIRFQAAMQACSCIQSSRESSRQWLGDARRRSHAFDTGLQLIACIDVSTAGVHLSACCAPETSVSPYINPLLVTCMCAALLQRKGQRAAVQCYIQKHARAFIENRAGLHEARSHTMQEPRVTPPRMTCERLTV